MRAVRIVAFGGAENLQLSDVPNPEPGPGEVVIRIARSGVNPVDRSQLMGRWQWLPPPHIPGSEIAGTIEAVGDGVPATRVGERVAVANRLFCGACYYCLRGQEQLCMSDPRSAGAPAIPGVFSEGGYAELTVVPSANALPVPEHVDFDLACSAALDGVTAWHMVDRSRVRAGERVLVVGATGGVGSFVLQICRLRGALPYAATGSMHLGGQLKGLGAEDVFDRTTDDIAAQVRDRSGGRGMDVVFDPTGAQTWPSSISSLARGGRYVTCGILTGPEVMLNLAPLYSQEHEIIGSTGGTRADLAHCLDAAARNALRAVIYKRFPLEEAGAALAALSDAGRLGKVLLTP